MGCTPTPIPHSEGVRRGGLDLWTSFSGSITKISHLLISLSQLAVRRTLHQSAIDRTNPILALLSWKHERGRCTLYSTDWKRLLLSLPLFCNDDYALFAIERRHASPMVLLTFAIG